MDRCKIYLEILGTAKAIVDKDIIELTEKIKAITTSFTGMNPSDIPDKYLIELETKKKNLEKLQKDEKIIDVYYKIVEKKINKTINDILPKLSTAEEREKKIKEVREKIENILKTFFTEYRLDAALKSDKVDLIHGESQFKRIMKSTSKYEKYGAKIEKVEKKLSKMYAKKALKGETKVSFLEQYRKDKIDYYQHQQCEIKSSRNLLLTKRQADIYRGNRDLSKHEGEAEFYTNQEAAATAAKAAAAAAGNLKEEKKQEKIIKTAKERAADAKQKVTILRKMDIVVQKARHVLWDQKLFSKFRSKYDEKGEIDTRDWEVVRDEKIDAKTGKKL